mmetsp:Transcript_27484/g.49733  ORF Transcript_27484/g.49733 Transcript_27484/m.49733 type:complete len:365 (+) Transcript_27484:182-1276(+)
MDKKEGTNELVQCKKCFALIPGFQLDKHMQSPRCEPGEKTQQRAKTNAARRRGGTLLKQLAKGKEEEQLSLDFSSSMALTPGRLEKPQSQPAAMPRLLGRGYSSCHGSSSRSSGSADRIASGAPLELRSNEEPPSGRNVAAANQQASIEFLGTSQQESEIASGAPLEVRSNEEIAMLRQKCLASEVEKNAEKARMLEKAAQMTRQLQESEARRHAEKERRLEKEKQEAEQARIKADEENRMIKKRRQEEVVAYTEKEKRLKEEKRAAEDARRKAQEALTASSKREQAEKQALAAQLAEETRKREEAEHAISLCSICQDTKANFAGVLCGHLIFCADCKEKGIYGTGGKCPICRADLPALIRIHL